MFRYFFLLDWLDMTQVDLTGVRNLITFIVSDFKILFACKTISNIFQMQIIDRKVFHII